MSALGVLAQKTTCQKQRPSTFTAIPNDLLDSHKFAELSPAAFKMYAVLRRHSGGDNRPVWPSRERLATLSGMSVSSVKRSLNELETAGFILRQFRTGCSTVVHFRTSDSNVLTFPTQTKSEPDPDHLESSRDQVRPVNPDHGWPPNKPIRNDKLELTNKHGGFECKQTPTAEGSFVGLETCLQDRSKVFRLLRHFGFRSNLSEIASRNQERVTSRFLQLLFEYVHEHPGGKTLKYPQRWAQSVIEGRTHFDPPRDLLRKPEKVSEPDKRRKPAVSLRSCVKCQAKVWTSSTSESYTCKKCVAEEQMQNESDSRTAALRHFESTNPSEYAILRQKVDRELESRLKGSVKKGRRIWEAMARQLMLDEVNKATCGGASSLGHTHGKPENRQHDAVLLGEVAAVHNHDTNEALAPA